MKNVLIILLLGIAALLYTYFLAINKDRRKRK